MAHPRAVAAPVSTPESAVLRLPPASEPHPDCPADPWCDLCGRDCNYYDFIPESGLVICPSCLEAELENACASH